MLKLSWRRALDWRLRRNFLDRRVPAGSEVAVASRLCGLHAQLLSSAELSLWARVEGLRQGAVQKALWQDRTLIKTWAMRGTLHLLPSNELPLWMGALATSKRYLRERAWMNNFGISLQQLDQITQAIIAGLDGRALTRDELVAEVERSTGIQIADSSWGTVFKPAAFAGGLCFAPSAGQYVRFTKPEAFSKMDPDEAAASVARRFLSAYGPATPADLGRWWNGGAGTARKWIGALGEEVVPVDLEGREAWMLAADVPGAQGPLTQAVNLLPAFDPYVVAASHHAEQIIKGAERARVFRPQGWISPVLLVNGSIAGVWSHQTKGSTVTVVIQPFDRVPASVMRGAGREAERLASFLEGKLVLEWDLKR